MDNGKKRNAAAVKITAAIAVACVVIELLLALDADVSFNFLRLWVTLALLSTFGALSYFDLWRVCFDPKNRNHTASAVALCATCVLIAVLLSSVLCPKRAEVKYPFEYPVSYYNPYEQQFDAFMKRQLNIDVEPSDELKALENPYDPWQREGIDYLWDRAYYDGSYYSYFGIAPILTVYYPYYLVNGALPSEDTVSAVFAILSSLFFSLAAVKFAAMSTKKSPLPLLWLLTLGGLLSTQTFLVMRGYARFYYIATIAGMAFLSAFIWLFLCGLSGSFALSPTGGKGKGEKYTALALAGVAYGLCFLSRLNMALLAAFAILPMLWFFVLNEKKDGKYKFRPWKNIICELLAIGSPVIAAVAVQLVLNYLRFDSFFEFGTTYQLTVSDISLNELRLSDLPYAIYHYFLHPVSFVSDFPFASLYYTSLESYGHFVYVDTGMGLFSIPFMWMLFGAIAVFVDKRQSRVRKITLASVIVGLVAVAWLDFCLGGVIYRYTCDLTVIGVFAAMAVVLFLCDSNAVGGNGEATAISQVLNVTRTLIVLLTAFVSLSLAFSKNANLTEYSEMVYKAFRSLFLVK